MIELPGLANRSICSIGWECPSDFGGTLGALSEAVPPGDETN